MFISLIMQENLQLFYLQTSNCIKKMLACWLLDVPEHWQIPAGLRAVSRQAPDGFLYLRRYAKLQLQFKEWLKGDRSGKVTDIT